MAVKVFLRNFHFSAYTKLSNLIFSEKKRIFFAEKVHSDVCLPLFSGFTSHRAVFLLLGLPNFFVLTFNKAFLVLELNFNIQNATKLFCRRL